ncbi:MAG: ArsR/SmtB family transcription factor [Candidatus Kariarchaeaceae archaeon]|jgi:DNA-binding HxlR family transcriptional regulator
MSRSEKEDLKTLFEEVIEEKLGALESEIAGIKSTMTAQYLSSIGRMLEREAKETIDDFACSYHPATEMNCKSSLKGWIAQYTNALSMGDLPEAFAVLSDFKEEAKKNVSDFDKGAHCKQDWKEIQKILNRHSDVAKDLSAQFTNRSVPADIGELDFSPEEMYEEVIFPLSHTLRLQIIHALKSGSKRFTALKDELDVKNTGLLVHHLKPLTEAGIIDQDFQKRYLLTDRGFKIARYFSQIAAAMHPQETTVTLGAQPSVTKLPMVSSSK